MLKALLLGLFPATEEETAEDFEQAYSILETLEVKFAGGLSGNGPDGFFWQTLFLCVMTSPTRRHGALNYITRRLPKFFGTGPAVSGSNELSQLPEETRMLISPEPGLLLRCFVAGLSDSNILVQRGYLDMLVTHLPMHSPVLLHAARQEDRDRLTSAAMEVLLRREVSLNRRLWTWLLGPDEKDSIPSAVSPSKLEAAPDDSAAREHPTPSSGLLQPWEYFRKYAKETLQRSLLERFSVQETSSNSRAKAFRICLSLMDRWEIGGSIIPEVFLPALRSLYIHSKSAAPNEYLEVLRSARLFFDGVEPGLIWSSILDLVGRSIHADGVNPGELDFLNWIVDTFNLREFEMTTVHAPLATLYVLGRIRRLSVDSYRTFALSVLGIMEKLARIISKEAFANNDSSVARRTVDQSTQQIEDTITSFYQRAYDTGADRPRPLPSAATAQMLVHSCAALASEAMTASSGERFSTSMRVLLSLPVTGAAWTDRAFRGLVHDVSAATTKSAVAHEAVDFRILVAVTLLLNDPRTTKIIDENQYKDIAIAVTGHTWQYLSPQRPKYHVEAARLLWQLSSLPHCSNLLDVALLDILHAGLHPPAGLAEHERARATTVHSFAIFWNHSVPSPSVPGTNASSRRASALPNTADAAEVTSRMEVLTPPLFRVLEALRFSSTPSGEAVSRWLGSLASLDQVFLVVGRQFQTILDQWYKDAADMRLLPRAGKDAVRNVCYVLTLYADLLKNATSWTWQCFSNLDLDTADDSTNDGPAWLVQKLLNLLIDPPSKSQELSAITVELLMVLVNSPAGQGASTPQVEERLLNRMVVCLDDGDELLQGPLLELIGSCIRMRAEGTGLGKRYDAPRRPSLAERTLSLASPSTAVTPSVTHSPPPQLIPCLRRAFTSPCARSHLDQWLQFLSAILPIFATAIFTSLIPLVETVCGEISEVFSELQAMTVVTNAATTSGPGETILCLLDALEMILARAHEALDHEGGSDDATKPQVQTNGFLGSMTSGVFRVEGPPSKTAQANSRLTVVLSFQDAIRCCLDVWLWTNNYSDAGDYDTSSAATTAYSAQRLRSKTRYLLEQMFAVEPLESLEVLMQRWRQDRDIQQMSATITLLQIMQCTAPKSVIPAILDAICTRTISSRIPTSRQSSQSMQLTAVDIVLFQLAYLQSLEDDAMDEIWSDCIAFLKDVLANPLPYRQIMAALLSLIYVLAQKVGNTNFGDQRRMRKDLGDIFQRLLSACLTTLSSGGAAMLDGTHAATASADPHDLGSSDTLTVLRRIMEGIETIVESPDRVAAVVASITSSVITPTLRSRPFPMSFSKGHLDLILMLLRKAPTSKPLRKDISDAFQDARLLTCDPDVIEQGWLPVIHQWALREKELLPELLAKLTPPTSAGIVFGVGASAARTEADRRSQLHLRRLSLLLLASPQDTWLGNLRELNEKPYELFAATVSSSPSAAIKADVFMLLRALTVSFTPTHLAPFWPLINQSLQAALMSLLSDQKGQQAMPNLGLLQACRLLGQLVALSPDDFQLHEWLYIVDTIDAVYRTPGSTLAALSDQVAEALSSGSGEEDESGANAVDVLHSATGSSEQLFGGSHLDIEDIRAFSHQDFARIVLRPALSQLSMRTYESVYNLEAADAHVHRRSLLMDILDASTVVA